MPTVVTTLILSLLFAQSAGQVKKTDREYDDLNGPVRSVRIEFEDLRDQSVGSKTNGHFLEKIALYDVSGRLTEEIRGFGNDCVSSRHVFSDDGNGKRTEAVYWGKSLAGDGKLDWPQSVASPVNYKQVFKLDGAGRRYEVNEYDDTGKLFRKAHYKYDDAGRVRETVDGQDSSQEQCELKYNEKGLVSEKSCRRSYSAGHEKSEYAYEYDASGNWIKQTAKSSSSRPNGSSYEYKRITYREIAYYSLQGDAAKQTADGFDTNKLAPCAPMIIRKSGGVLQGSAIKRVEPRYPLQARAAGISGSVVVEVTVDEAGKVFAARTISGPPELREVSVSAARGWEFQRTTLSKVPVRVIGTITFNFNL
ncbi:MAG TPA: energy transducer TonB [Blastocatellia bacterium]|nr:energy transducer TonB [Blastocatellia bacterium]